MARGNKKQKTSNGVATNKLPTFDESALTALTDSIEKKFAGNKIQLPDDGPSVEGADKPKSKKEKKHKIKEDNKASGKKRDANGNVKSSKQAKSNGKIDRETLLKEILSMGGTAEDLDLIGDADSDDEDLDEKTTKTSTIDANFAKELSQFVTGLGIEAPEEDENDGEEAELDVEDGEEEEAIILDNDDDEEADAGKEWEEVSSADEVPIVPETKKDKKEKKAEKKDKKDENKPQKGPQDPNRLVSRPHQNKYRNATD